MIETEYIVKGEPIPKKLRWSERLEKYYESEEFQNKRKQWHEPDTKIKIKSSGKANRNIQNYKPTSSIDLISEESKPINVSFDSNYKEDKAYQDARAVYNNSEEWKKWKWENGREIPTTHDKILQESRNFPTYKNREERIQAEFNYLSTHGKTRITKVLKDLNISQTTLYDDIPIAENRRLFINDRGFLRLLNPVPVDYDLPGFHNMGFTFDNKISYGVYAEAIKRLNSKPIINDFSGRGINTSHGNQKAKYKTYLPIESSDNPFQHSELSTLWLSIQESFSTNRFKLTDFELNIDMPYPKGTKIEMANIRYSRRDIEGFIRAYIKNEDTYRKIDLPINLKDIGGLRKPEEILPLLDSILGGYDVFKKGIKKDADFNELQAKYRKACKIIENYEKTKSFKTGKSSFPWPG